MSEPPSVAGTRQALRETQHQYRALAEQSRDPIYILQDGQFVFVNSAWERLFGYERAEVLSPEFDYLQCIIAPASRPAVRKRQRRHANDEPVPDKFRFQARTQDGELLTINMKRTDVLWNGQPATQGIYEIVTEHHETRRALQESEERWRRLVEDHPVPLIIIQGTQLSYVNEATVELLGAARSEDLLDRDVQNFLAPEDHPKFLERNAQVRRGQELPPTLYHVQRLDGEKREVEVYVNHIQYEGKPAQQVVVRDVTEQRRRERDQRERTKRLRRQQNALMQLTNRQADAAKNLDATFAQITETLAHTLKIARASIWLYEKDHVLFRCRDRYDWNRQEHIQGKTRDAWLHDNYFQALVEGRISTFPEAQTDDRLRSFQPYLKNEDITSVMSAPIRVEGDLAGVLLLEHRGGLRSWTSDEQHFAGSVTDLTALALESERRYRTEQELRASRTRYQQVADTIGEVLFRTDQKGRWTFLNPAWTQCTGYDVEESLGDFFLDLVPSSDYEQELEKYRSLFSSDIEHTQSQMRIQRKDGQIRWIEVQYHFMRDEKGQLQGTTGTFLDITERKKTEQALRDAETKFRSLVEQSITGVFIMQQQGFAYVNPRLAEIFGYSEDELMNLDDVSTLLVPEDRSQVLDIAVQLLSGQVDNYHHTFRGRHQDGSIIHVEAYGKRADHEGQSAIIGTLVDITERVESEQALRASERRYRQIFENNQAVQLLIDPETGRIEEANAAAAAFYGYSLEQLCGMNIKDINQLPPERVEKTMQDVRTTKSGHLRLKHRSASGELRDVEVYSSPVEINGKSYLYSIVQDITEQVASEQALRESQELLSSINENVTEAIYRSKQEGGLIYANQAFARMFGYDSVEEVLNTPSTSLYADPSERIRRNDEMDASDTMRNEEIQFRRRDGSTFWGLLNSRAILDDDGEPIYWDGAITNITDRKERERALVAAKEEAEQMNRLKSTFLANMSHEIRTPLTSIIGFADVLAGELGDDSKLELIDMIRQSGNRLMETLNSVLHLSQLEGGSLDLSLKPLDVTEAVRESVDTFRPQADEKDLKLSIEEPSAEKPLVARLDPGAFHRVLNNLISNAIKFTEEGYVTVRLAANENKVHVSVEDSGIGINAAFQEEMFEEFKQESSGLSREHEGSGLGLAITKQLTDRMKGHLAVESEKGQGSTFTVSFPRHNAIRGDNHTR